MKNIKIYTVISLLFAGFIMSSCSSETPEEKAKKEAEKILGIENLDDALDSMDDQFNKALEEMEDDGMLDDTNVDTDELKDFHEAVQEKDFDEAIDIYEKYLIEYMDKTQEVAKGDISNMDDVMALSMVVTKISMELLPHIPEMSDDQKQRFDDIDKKLKEMDKNN